MNLLPGCPYLLLLGIVSFEDLKWNLFFALGGLALVNVSLCCQEDGWLEKEADWYQWHEWSLVSFHMVQLSTCCVLSFRDLLAYFFLVINFSNHVPSRSLIIQPNNEHQCANLCRIYTLSFWRKPWFLSSSPWGIFFFSSFSAITKWGCSANYFWVWQNIIIKG